MSLLRSLPTEYVYSESKDVLNQDVYTFLLVSPRTFALTGFQEYRPMGSKTVHSRQEGKEVNGVKVYREHMRYFTHNRKDEMRCWLPSYKNFDSARKRGYIWVCEGIFSAGALVQLGEPVVAILTSDNKPVLRYLRDIGLKLYGFCDGDKAGQELGKQLDEVVQLPEGKDLEDMYFDKGLTWVRAWVDFTTMGVPLWQQDHTQFIIDGY